MHFDDGSDPYRDIVDHVTVLRAGSSSISIIYSQYFTYSALCISYIIRNSLLNS